MKRAIEIVILYLKPGFGKRPREKERHACLVVDDGAGGSVAVGVGG